MIMQTSDKETFRDMQEHPEKYSDQELEAMMDDLDQVPDVEAAWQTLKEKDTATVGPSLRKIAASFIGVLLVSGIAFAAIRIWSDAPASSQESEESSYTQAPDTTRTSPVLPLEEQVETPVIYDNIPLENMLSEIAAHYHAEVIFQNDAVRSLRFHFLWNPRQELGKIVSDLNHFERLHVTLKNNQITVDGLSSPSEK